MERVTHAMRRQKWEAIVRECNESGKKKKEWLEEHGIDPKLFYRWQKRLRMEIGTELILSQQKEQSTAVSCLPEFGLAACGGQGSCKNAHSVIIRKGEMEIELNEDIPDLFLLRIIKAVSNA